MDEKPSSSAPDPGSVLKFVASHVWKSKWLIGATTVVAAAVAFALTPTSDSVEAWSGRATLMIGIEPSIDYILFRSGLPFDAVDTPRKVVGEISDPEFRRRVVSSAAFEPGTAVTSRSMVASSLRGIVLDGDRYVAVELYAGSAADVQAALGSFDAEISKIHDKLLSSRLDILQGRISDSKRRVAAIETASAQLNDRIFGTFSDEKTTQRALTIAPILMQALPTWNDLQDQIEQDENLRSLSERTTMHIEPTSSARSARSVRTLRFSLLAGLVMFLAMICLTVGLSRSVRAGAD